VGTGSSVRERMGLGRPMNQETRRNYRPRRPSNARGGRRIRGPFAAGKKEILALGPKTSPGGDGVFCRGGGQSLKLRHFSSRAKLYSRPTHYTVQAVRTGESGCLRGQEGLLNDE